MLKWLKSLLGAKAKDGFRVSLFSTGKPFDPRDQKRTTPTEDFIKGKRKNGKV